MRNAFITALTDLAAQDPRVTLVVGDLGFGVVLDFAKRFPKQFINAGVAEQNMTSLAAGLALAGKIVFTYSIGNFPTLRCLEQIRNDVCYHNANVKIICVGGGFAYGALGSTHHATEDLAIMRALPQLTVVAPGDPLEAAQAIRAVARLAGPCYLRLGRAGEPVVHQENFRFELGRAITVRQGSDGALLATGSMLPVAARVADILHSKGHKLRVLSVPTLKPLDADEVVKAARETGMVVTLEEHSIIGGLGGAVAEVLCEAGVEKVFFKRLGLPSVFTKLVGDQEYLRTFHGLGENEILTYLQEILEARLIQCASSRRKSNELESEVHQLPAPFQKHGNGNDGHRKKSARRR